MTAFVPGFFISTVAVGYFTWVRNSEIEENFAHRAELVAQKVAARSAGPIAARDISALSEICRLTLDEEPWVAKAMILGSRGEPLAYVSRDHSKSAGRNQFSAPLEIYKTNREGKLATDQLGVAMIEANPGLVEAEQTTLLDQAFTTLLWLSGLSFLIAMYVSRNLYLPISRIARTVTQMAKGDFSSRVDPVGDSCIKELAEGINEMAARVQNSHKSLTEQVEIATKELRKERDEANRVSVAMSRFVASVSHDLRQPMQALKLFSSEMALHTLPQGSRGILGQMITSIEILDYLIESFLDISRLDSGAVSKNTRVFSIQDLMKKIRVDALPMAVRRGVELRFHVTSFELKSDPALVERIVRNLVGNAIRYTGSTVLVGARLKGCEVMIEVRDNGPGISNEHLKLIFDDFVQLNNPERNKEKGIGLGLGIARRLAKLLGTEVHVRSCPGKGSTFGITVPRAESQQSVDSLEDFILPQTPFEGTKVALVGHTDSELFERKVLDDLHCIVSRYDDVTDFLSKLSEKTINLDFAFVHFENSSENARKACCTLVKSHPTALPIAISGLTIAQFNENKWPANVIYVGSPVRAGKIRAILQRLIENPLEQ